MKFMKEFFEYIARGLLMLLIGIGAWCIVGLFLFCWPITFPLGLLWWLGWITKKEKNPYGCGHS